MAKDDVVAAGSTRPLVRGGGQRADDHDLDHLIVLTHPIYAGEEPEPEATPAEEAAEPPTKDGFAAIPRPRDGAEAGFPADGQAMGRKRA